MKALHELRCMSIFCFEQYQKTKNIDWKDRRKTIEEAIKELELLSNSLQLKTCDGCKNCDEHMWCTFFANGTTVQPKFYCAGYEPKDKQ